MKSAFVEFLFQTFDGYKLGQNLKWIRLANMDIARWHVTCLEWSGYIWTFGGVDKQFNARKSVERYDPKTNKWTIMPEMIHPRSKTATAIWSDRIIVAGGRGTVSKVISTVECFNPEDGSWTELPNMPACLRGHSLVSYKNKIIAMGGIDDEDVYQNTVYELDPLGKNPTWKSLQPMKYPAAFFSGIVLGDKIYKIGGYQGQKRYLDRVEIFDGEDWLEGPPLPFMWEFWMSAMSISQNLADSLCNHRPR